MFSNIYCLFRSACLQPACCTSRCTYKVNVTRMSKSNETTAIKEEYNSTDNFYEQYDVVTIVL